MTLTSTELDRVFTWPEEKQTNQYYRHSSPNPSYEPAACGLDIIDQLDEDGLCYEFNTIMAWRDTETGKVYVAQDSGCSCPTPFEGFKKLSELTLIVNTLDAQAFVRAANPERYNSPEPTFAMRDVMRFLSKIDAALRGEVLAAA